jgi:hypothetical protein
LTAGPGYAETGDHVTGRQLRVSFWNQPCTNSSDRLERAPGRPVHLLEEQLSGISDLMRHCRQDSFFPDQRSGGDRRGDGSDDHGVEVTDGKIAENHFHGEEHPGDL